tara:strand:+ start:229 stop:1224 length:996 start_codon:yes stop_codon:yes gene_type:complete
MKVFLTRENQKLIDNVVFIDGFSSSGKALIAPIFGFLERGEQWQVDYFFEKLAVLSHLDKISKKNIKTVLEAKVDELIYNLFIGRNINSRKTDLSSPFFNGLGKKYLKRIKLKEKGPAMKRILQAKPILPIMVHYIYGCTDIFLKSLQGKLGLYVIMLRDPFHLIDVWHKDKWVKKRGRSNREFHLCIKVKNKIIPWYAKEYSKDYIKANNLEKAILTVYHLYKRVFSMYKRSGSNEKKKILLVFFDEFIKYPDLYINKICKRLKTKRIKNFQKIIKKRLSLPRIHNDPITSIEIFKKKYSKKISKHYLDMLFELNDNYIDFYKEKKLSKS